MLSSIVEEQKVGLEEGMYNGKTGDDSSDSEDDSILHYQPFRSKRSKEIATKRGTRNLASAKRAPKTGPVIDRLISIPAGMICHQFYPTLEVRKVVWLGTWNTTKSFIVLLTDGEHDVELCFHPDHAKRLCGLFLKKKKKMVAGARIKLENYYMKEKPEAEHGRIIVASRIRTLRAKKVV
jgi:hypothetical protein